MNNFYCVRVQFEVGHEASIRNKRTVEGFTHDWEVFVRGIDNAEIHNFIEKVVFHLHETFPKPKRTVKEPPYSVKESGYAGFNLPIDIYFKCKEEHRKIRLFYDLTLQPVGPRISNVIREKTDFTNPSEDFRRKLIKGGGIGIGGDGNVGGEKGGGGGASEERKSSPLTSKPKLALVEPNKKHKSKDSVKPEEGKVSNSFALFGTPIKAVKHSPTPSRPASSGKQPPQQPELPKQAPASHEKPVKESSKSSKHSPRKDKDSSSGSSSSLKKEKDGVKEKDRSKEREERHRDKEKKTQVLKESLKKEEKVSTKKHKDKKYRDEKKEKRNTNKKEEEVVNKEEVKKTTPIKEEKKRPPLDKEKQRHKHKKKDKYKEEEKERMNKRKDEIKVNSPPVARVVASKPIHPLNTIIDEKDSESEFSSHEEDMKETSPPPLVSKPLRLVGEEKKKHERRDEETGRKRKRKSRDKDEPIEKVRPAGGPHLVAPLPPAVALPPPTPPPPPETTSTSLFTDDYVTQLKDLQHKIMTLQDNADLQRVVQVISETGQFEITQRTFDFDLCALDPSTVRRLQEMFIAAS